jgi:hypothetical protein
VPAPVVTSDNTTADVYYQFVRASVKKKLRILPLGQAYQELNRRFRHRDLTVSAQGAEMSYPIAL